MDTDTLRQTLQDAGLTEYQAETYLTLLELGSAPVVTIAERSSVPAPQVYEAVRSLEERSFVETIDRDKLHASVREPTEVVDQLQHKSKTFSTAADEIEDRWERPDEQDYRINVLKRRETVLERVEDAIQEAEVSIELSATLEQFERLQPALREAHERGVVTRVTLSGNIEEFEPTDPGVLQLRWRSLPSPFLAIVDRRRAFFAPAAPHGEPYGVLVADDILTLVLHWFHLTVLWLPCTSLYVEPERPPTYISVEEFLGDVAPLWHDGATIRIGVAGQIPETGERAEIEGDLVYAAVGEGMPVPRAPTVPELSGYATLLVDDGETVYSVGGWGAIVEDIEGEVITIEDVTMPVP